MKKESKYQAVVSFLKKGIESGKFPTGSRLPSIRQLSQDFHCSKDTIQRALLELRHEQSSMPNPKVATMFWNKDSTKTWKSKSLRTRQCLWWLPTLCQWNPDRPRKLSLQLLWQPRRPWGTETICPSTSFQPSPLLQARPTGSDFWHPASSLYPFSD